MQMNPTEDWLKTEWARHSQTRARLVDSLLFITCSLENNVFSVLHYVIKVTLHYLKLHRFEIHSALKVLSGTSLLGFRREAASSLAKTVKLKAFICKEGERKTKDFAVFYYIRHQIAAYASISKHFSYLAIFWYFNYTNFVMIKFILRRRDEGIYIPAFSQASMPSMNFWGLWGLFEMFQSKWVYLTIIHRSGGGEAAR